MVVVAFVSFSLFNFVGDPVNSMTGEDASDERRAEVREVLGQMILSMFSFQDSLEILFKVILVYLIN